MSGTSNGMVVNTIPDAGFPQVRARGCMWCVRVFLSIMRRRLQLLMPVAAGVQETHFLFLERHGISWKGYYTDDPWMFPAFADLKTAASLEVRHARARKRMADA